MAITANITVPSKGNSVSVTQSTQSVSVSQNSPSQISIVDRQSIVGVSAASDKHFTANINVNDWTANGNEWETTITHNLKKKPSVTVVDSFNQTQYPDVEYIDDNNVKLIVRGQFSGKAHFN